jgi:hypothetical protein
MCNSIYIFRYLYKVTVFAPRGRSEPVAVAAGPGRSAAPHVTDGEVLVALSSGLPVLATLSTGVILKTLMVMVFKPHIPKGKI